MLRLLVPLLFTTPLAAQQVGTRLSPDLVVENLAQTPAKELSDFAGRALVIEFFAHWCGPCARAVPHMNEILHQYGPRGLSIVSVTDSPPEKAEPWVKDNGMEYAYGYDPKNRLQAYFGIDSIPHAVLVDPFGKIVWAGHPMQLPAEAIEEALQGVASKPAWEWPEPARPMARSLWKGDWEGAARVAVAAGASEIFDARVASVLKHYEGLVAARRYAEANAFGNRMKAELGNLPAAQTLAQSLEKLLADPEAQRFLEAEARYSELESTALSARKVSVLEEVRPKLDALIRDFPGSDLGRRAQSLAERIDRALAQHR